MTKKPDVEDRLTLQAIDAISSDEDDGDDVDDGEGKEEWNAEAQALRQAIADGAFNHLLIKSKGKAVDELDCVEDDFCEEDSEQDDSDRHDDAYTEVVGAKDEETDHDDEGEVEEKALKTITSTAINSKALAAVYEELQTTKKGMSWSELFVVTADKPLPFGGIGADGSPLDIHDDLKRELAFYSQALDAANEARIACRQTGIPFSRPDDFFAEMVKTDGESLS